MRWEINAFFAAIGLALSCLIGEWHPLFLSLLILITLDYLTGVLAAYQQKKLHSRKGLIGIYRKTFFLFPLIIGHQLDLTLTLPDISFRQMVLFFLISNESLSILENLTRLGVPFPPALKDKLQQLKPKNEYIAKQDKP